MSLTERLPKPFGGQIDMVVCGLSWHTHDRIPSKRKRDVDKLNCGPIR